MDTTAAAAYASAYASPAALPKLNSSEELAALFAAAPALPGDTATALFAPAATLSAAFAIDMACLPAKFIATAAPFIDTFAAKESAELV